MEVHVFIVFDNFDLAINAFKLLKNFHEEIGDFLIIWGEAIILGWSHSLECYSPKTSDCQE